MSSLEFVYPHYEVVVDFYSPHGDELFDYRVELFATEEEAIHRYESIVVDGQPIVQVAVRLEERHCTKEIRKKGEFGEYLERELETW